MTNARIDFDAPKLSLDALPQLKLAAGGHGNREDGLCVMEAVAWLAGEEHSDHPDCACPTIAAWARRTNDALGQPYRDALRDRILRIAGSKASLEVERKRIRELAWRAVARIIPVRIEILTAVPQLSELKDELLQAAEIMRGIGRNEPIASWRAPAQQARATVLKALARALDLDLDLDLDLARALALDLARALDLDLALALALALARARARALDLALDLALALARARARALDLALAERLKAECLAALDAMLDIAE